MIRNDQELESALQWIEYWKSNRSVGQSWLGHEQAGRKISELRRQVDAYRRQKEGLSPIPPAAPDDSPEENPV